MSSVNNSASGYGRITTDGATVYEKINIETV